MKSNKIKKVLSYSLIVFTMMFVNLNSVLADNNIATTYVKCGDSTFPEPVAAIVRTVILLLQIVIPIGIIVMGSLDFLKATIAGDSDKMKKNQKQFVTRLIAGAITFFVFVIVKFMVSMFADQSDSESFTNCLDCLINNEGSCNTVTNSPFDPDPEIDTNN